MMKTKLALRTQTLLPLTDDGLRHARGGFIMRDSVIVRTSTRLDEQEPIEPGRP